jgi:hypothetical protein
MSPASHHRVEWRCCKIEYCRGEESIFVLVIIHDDCLWIDIFIDLFHRAQHGELCSLSCAVIGEIRPAIMEHDLTILPLVSIHG